MPKYLDPKADLTFKKVFAEHKDLMISFLNALLPLDGDSTVRSIEYLPAELVPNNPLKKDTIVDVRCTDQIGRGFIVEMQMIWTSAFQQRVLFNASKVYSHQLDKGGSYSDLKPVFSLNLVNDVFRHDTDECYHDYGIVDMKYKEQVIEGIHLIFIELPKFKPHSFKEKRMAVLWLRYLTEINEQTRKAPQELLDNPETRKALDIVEESAYTDVQMAYYDDFWDAVRIQRMFADDAKNSLQKGYEKGMQKGMAQGMEKGIEKGMAQGMAQGMEKGAHEEKIRNAKKMKQLGMPTDTIGQITGLAVSEIETL